MRELGVVLRRELLTYFASAIAYVFGGLFLFVLLYVTVDMLEVGRATDTTAFFRVLPWVLLGFVPALTMRLWSEERKLGTLELLMTLPVRRISLVLGKFSAAVCFVTILLVLTLGLPFSLALHGPLDWGPVLAGYLGSILLVCAYTAVGMFFSSLTRDQIIAFLSASVVLLVLGLFGHDSFLIVLRDAGIPRSILEAFGAMSPTTYFRSIGRGVLDTRDILYFVVFCGVFLHGTVLVLERRRTRG